MPRITTTQLSQKLVDATPIPKSGFVTLRDHVERGLICRIWHTDTKKWALEFRSPVTGKNARLGLRADSLAAARAAAKQLRAQIAAGRDPGLETKQEIHARKEARTKALTVLDALGLYHAATVANAVRARSRRGRFANLSRTLEPFHEMLIADLKRGMIILELDRVQATRGPIIRNRSQAEIRILQGWLYERGLIPTIELAGIKKAVQERGRERVLSDPELRAILKATNDHAPFSDVIVTLLHTAMRRGEAANLQPRDLDFDAMTIRVRAEVAKTNQTRLLPMDAALAPMLKERAGRVGEQKYIFGDGTDYRRPFGGWDRRVTVLRQLVGANEAWGLHDVRRTVATRLHDAGVDSLVIEDLLGHTSGLRAGVKGVYNRAQTLERQRPALRQWAIKLASLTDN